MTLSIGILLGLAVAAALYVWKSGDKPAKSVRSIFARRDRTDTR